MLSKVIHARLVEIIDQVFLEVKNYGSEESKKKLIAGIVLTGGGSQLKHIKQLFEYETAMDTRIGYPNEHLGKGDKPELESPMYATAIGLLMKGVGENEKRPQPKEVEETPIDPTDGPIGDLEDDEGSIKKPIEIEKQGSASVFDKWANKLLDFLANED